MVLRGGLPIGTRGRRGVSPLCPTISYWYLYSRPENASITITVTEHIRSSLRSALNVAIDELPERRREGGGGRGGGEIRAVENEWETERET